MMYLTSYLDAGHGRFIGTVHESGATSMADGFHRFSGRLGVASVTRARASPTR
jgi:thiamine pyrophosphate-dependent acetolactate synthase large subunit-like protein